MSESQHHHETHACEKYINSVIKCDTSFNTFVNDLDLCIYQCRWEFAEQLYHNFKYIENNRTIQPEHIARLKQDAVIAYATTHRQEKEDEFERIISEYISSQFGI